MSAIRRGDAQAREHLALALAIFVLVYVAVTTLSLPVATALSLLAGALFGRPLMQWGHEWVVATGVGQFRRRALN